ncbi:MAG TPA: single-stranded DNA-binding protein, partial [Candidatus Moranbacteria bacterium]|nr:single-stranded DNA-binding protein [Candidatus Moranbacteria bacterium]
FEGRLQTRAYTGKDGVERRTTEIVAETMQFGSKPGAGGGSNSGYARPAAAAAVAKPQTPSEKIPTINLDEEQGEIRLEDVPF